MSQLSAARDAALQEIGEYLIPRGKMTTRQIERLRHGDEAEVFKVQRLVQQMKARGGTDDPADTPLPDDPATERKRRANSKWLDTFVDEKGYDPEQTFDHERPGATHMVSLGSITQAFHNAPLAEQEAIKKNIVRLDFSDPAAPLKYLGHLGGALADNYEREAGRDPQRSPDSGSDHTIATSSGAVIAEVTHSDLTGEQGLDDQGWVRKGREDYDGNTSVPMTYPTSCDSAAQRAMYRRGWADRHRSSRTFSAADSGKNHLQDGQTEEGGTCPLHEGDWGSKAGCYHCTDDRGLPRRSDAMSEDDYQKALSQQTLDPSAWEQDGYVASDGSRATPRPQDFPAALTPGEQDTPGGSLTAARSAFSRGWQRRFHEMTDAESARVSPVNLYVDEAGRLVRSASPDSRSVKVRGPQGKEVATKAVGALRPATRDEVAQAGKDSGVCQVCGRALHDDRSKARGIGPTCLTRLA